MRLLIPLLALILVALQLRHDPVSVENTLLAYLDLADDGRMGRSSRSQAVFLRSMAVQHPDLRVRVVDVSNLDPEARRDRSFDWNLRDLDLEPLSPKLDAWFRGTLPTVVLFDREGALVRRWEGFASAAELGPAIHDSLDTRKQSFFADRIERAVSRALLPLNPGQGASLRAAEGSAFASARWRHGGVWWTALPALPPRAGSTLPTVR